MNKEEKIKVVIQGRQYLFDEDKVSYVKLFKDKTVSTISFKEPQPINFKIGDVENRDKQVSRIRFSRNGKFDISFNEPQLINFKIGDVENRDKQVSYIILYRSGEFSIYFKEPQQPINFKIGDVENRDKQVSRIRFSRNGKFDISFNEPQLINFKIRDIPYHVKMTNPSFYKEGLIENFVLAEDFKGSFSYNGEKYNLQFNSGEIVSFDVNGELNEYCIKKSIERFNEVFGKKITILERSQEKTKQEVKELQTNQNIATWRDWGFVAICIAISFGLFSFAYLNEPMIGNPVSFVRKNPDINKYVFLFEILKRAPIIILVILGFKFIQLAFERIRLVGEVEKVQKYIKLTNDDTTKNKLLKIIALPFFVPKKMKSSVVAKLKDRGSSVALEGKEETG